MVGVELSAVHHVPTEFRQLLSLKRQSSAIRILSQELFHCIPVLAGFFFCLTLSSFSRLFLCLFVRISSMILRLLTSKRSMEKQESQFIDGTKFNKKDAFRES